MQNRDHDSDDGIEQDGFEDSPSTGWSETAECMHVDAGLGDREGFTVTDGEETLQLATLEPTFSKDYLEVSS